MSSVSIAPLGGSRSFRARACAGEGRLVAAGESPFLSSQDDAWLEYADGAGGRRIAARPVPYSDQPPVGLLIVPLSFAADGLYERLQFPPPGLLASHPDG